MQSTPNLIEVTTEGRFQRKITFEPPCRLEYAFSSSNDSKQFGFVTYCIPELKVDEQDVLEPTRVAGLENFGENNLLLLTLTKVKPGKHLHIQRVLRKILKDTFSQEEIELCGFCKN